MTKQKMIPYGQQWIDDDDIKNVVEVLNEEWITTGPRIDEFETNLSAYIGCSHAIAVNSGTSALDIAVKALDIPVGSEVITTPFTFVATPNSILYNNLKPVFSDIREDTRNIDPDDIRKRIGDKTRAITYVDYAGHPCDFDEIKEIAEEYDLYLIEDACHAIGAEYHGKKTGNFADITVFSFHPVKHITTGEGGALVTDDDVLVRKLRMLRNHGIDRNARDRFGPEAGWAYDIVELGRNYRMTDFQAALGISQLKKLDGFIKRRNEIAKIYNSEFEGFDYIENPVTLPNIRHAWHIYTVLLKGVDRNNLFTELRKRGIGVNVHYIPSYRFTYYQNHVVPGDLSLPVTEDVFNRIITLPLYPKMSDEDIYTVIDTVKTTIEELS